MASETLVMVTGYVPEELADAVKAAVKRDKRTVSFAVGEGLRLWLENADTRSKT